MQHVPNGIKLGSNTPLLNELRASRCDRVTASGTGSPFDGAGLDMRCPGGRRLYEICVHPNHH